MDGSINGGTKVTITGGPFSQNILENPVKIGNTDCIVQDNSNKEELESIIVCITQPKVDPGSGTTAQRIDVMLKDYEMALCDIDPAADYIEDPVRTCTFIWKENLPTITSINATWNEIGYFDVFFVGDFYSNTNFSGRENDVTVVIDGVEHVGVDKIAEDYISL